MRPRTGGSPSFDKGLAIPPVQPQTLGRGISILRLRLDVYDIWILARLMSMFRKSTA